MFRVAGFHTSVEEHQAVSQMASPFGSHSRHPSRNQLGYYLLSDQGNLAPQVYDEESIITLRPQRGMRRESVEVAVVRLPGLRGPSGLKCSVEIAIGWRATELADSSELDVRVLLDRAALANHDCGAPLQPDRCLGGVDFLRQKRRRPGR